MDEQKLWPVDQLLQRLDSVNTKYLTIKPPQLWLLICLLKFADNRTLTCFPSVARLANITGQAESTVHKSIKLMVKAGILFKKNRVTKKGDPDSNEYRINPNKLWAKGCYCPYPPPRIAPPSSVDRTTPSVDRSLTTQLTTHLPKQQSRWPKKDQETAPVASVTNQSTTFGYEPETAEERARKYQENLERMGLIPQVPNSFPTKVGDKLKKYRDKQEAKS